MVRPRLALHHVTSSQSCCQSPTATGETMLSDQQGEELAEAMQVVFHWLRRPDTTPLNIHSPQLVSANCLKHLHHFDRQTTSASSPPSSPPSLILSISLFILCLHLKQPNAPHSATPFGPGGISIICPRPVSITLTVITTSDPSLIPNAHLKVSSTVYRPVDSPVSLCPTTSKVMMASKVTMDII